MKRELAVFALIAGCTQGQPQSQSQSQSQSRSSEPLGPIAHAIAAAAAEAGVPADLMTAIAVEEGGIALARFRAVDADDHVPVAGALELRHGRLDTLALGAQLLGTTEDALRADTELGTRAGARVLAWLGARTGAGAELASWRAALEQLSGLDDANAAAYASHVLGLLRAGGSWQGAAGERIALAPHAEIAASDTILVLPPPASTPDYPGAIWFTTSCTNKCTVGRPLGNASVNRIVIHDTEGGWDASVATLQNDSGKSVHYIVDSDGSRVGQFRPETDTTWHAGNYYYNETSIGIEHVGYAGQPFSKALYATSVKLVKSIRTRWSVPLDRKHIIGHYQIPNLDVISETAAPCAAQLDTCETSASYGGADNHRDPGETWQWCEYMEKLGGSCTCNDAWDHFNCTTDGTEAWRCDSDGTLEEEKCTGPAGCTVEPVGQDDACDTSSADGSGGSDGSDGSDGSGSTSGSDGSDGGGSDGGGSGGDTGSSGGDGSAGEAPGASASGCAATDGAGGGSAFALLALALVVASRRRPARAS